MRICNSEYERGWWDCFDDIKKAIEPHEFDGDVGEWLNLYLNELEKDFNVKAGKQL